MAFPSMSTADGAIPLFSSLREEPLLRSSHATVWCVKQRTRILFNGNTPEDLTVSPENARTSSPCKTSGFSYARPIRFHISQATLMPGLLLLSGTAAKVRWIMALERILQRIVPGRADFMALTLLLIRMAGESCSVGFAASNPDAAGTAACRCRES